MPPSFKSRKQAGVKIAKYTVFAIAITVVIVAVWLNRESSQVVSTLVVTIIAVVSAAWLTENSPSDKSLDKKIVLALFGAFLSLWLLFVFNSPARIERMFPVAFFVERPDNLPMVITNRPFVPQELFDEARQSNPSAFSTLSNQDLGSFDRAFYQEFLEKLIVEWIALRHQGTWRMDIDRFDSGSLSVEEFRPSADASGYGSTVLTAADLEQKLNGNRFARVHGFEAETLALPEGMSFTIRRIKATNPTGEIRFRDRYCELTITTTFFGAGVGLGGYTLLLGLPLGEAQKRYFSVQFIVRIYAGFKPFLMGHPAMAAHRDWAQGIIDGLAHAFDEESIWRQTVSSYMLLRHVPQQYPEIPFGASRWTAPPSAH